MIKIKVDTQYSNNYGKTKYFSEVKEFNNEQHFENWCKAIERNGKVKIIGSQRVFSEDKDFTMSDLKAAFECGKSDKF